MKSISQRIKTLIILVLMYIAAISGAVIGFLVIPIDNVLIKMFFSDIIATIIIWALGLLIKNASVYDPYWSIVPPLIVIGWIIVLQSNIKLSVILLMLAIVMWSIRLTLNWADGWVDFSVQDWRYTMIHNKHPRLWFIANLWGINLMPTIIVFFQLANAYYFLRAEPEVNLLIVVGFSLCIVAVFIQYISDRQMTSFRHRNHGKQQCINEGLWKFSRHPNYFGEVLMWWGVWVMYFGTYQTINILLLAPMAMTALFLFISIPMMEKKILSSRPEYKIYQKSVSILIPFFPLKRRICDETICNEKYNTE
ncbi:MAG: DUF1295 domain-containing protein [Candidatus Izemoplasmatales bacterium]|jgi:steroid 5-alpha reductase family enzyme